MFNIVFCFTLNINNDMFHIINKTIYKSQNTISLDFNVDPAPCKKAWSAALLLENLILPSDFWPHGKVAQDYGIFIEDKGIYERANILIDENGIVVWVKVYSKSQLPNLDEVFQVLSNM